MYDVQLRCGSIVAQSRWLPQFDLRVGVDQDSLLFQILVQQKNAMVDKVGDQHVTFAVHRQVTRCLDVVESSELDAVDVYFNHLRT